MKLAAIDRVQRRAMSPRRLARPSDQALVWALSYDTEENAVLTMPGWALYKRKWDRTNWLERKLDEVVVLKPWHDSLPAPM